MKLVVNTDLKNNTYKVNLNVLDITDTDREKISDFGEIIVDVGGVIKGEGTEQKYVAVQVPSLDEEGNPVTKDKVDEDGNIVYQLVEETVQIVLADLGKVLRQFPSDFPLTRDFAVTEFGDKAEELALTYIDLIKAELEEKIKLLEDKTDTFSGTFEYQL